ncbi:MAG: shikimate dehydrogenase [Candidatus Levyibacteriota bacterium]
MKITAKTKTCMVIGDPIEHSLSPVMHNAGYKALRIDNDFVYIAADVKPAHLAEAVQGFRALQIKGVSVTLPHKTTIMQYLDTIDDAAQKIGAVNTIVNDKGKLKGLNTDWTAIIISLEKITKLSGKNIALLGAGGAARGALYAFTQNGGKVTIFNRTIEAAKKLAKEFDCKYASLNDLEKVADMEIIFNATSVGLHPNTNHTPLPNQYITKKHIVFDAIYSPYETRLLREAKQQGAQIIHGMEMFLHQGMTQFELYTNHIAPEEMIRKVLQQYV